MLPPPMPLSTSQQHNHSERKQVFASLPNEVAEKYDCEIIVRPDQATKECDELDRV